MFENLSERLESAFKQIKGEGRITELNIAATVKDIRRALIDADVNYKIAKEFTDTVREKALGQKVLTAVSPGQLMIKVVKDELASLMGGEASELNAKGSPAVILITDAPVATQAPGRKYSRPGRRANQVACGYEAGWKLVMSFCQRLALTAGNRRGGPYNSIAKPRRPG